MINRGVTRDGLNHGQHNQVNNRWPQKCAECQATALGKMDTDGTFYCNACWEMYE